MLKGLRGIGIGVGVLAALVVTLLLLLTLTRGRTPAIPGANSVATAEMLTLGGVEQFVVTRGADRDKPVLLMLHGGPGLPLTLLRGLMSPGLEENFVVVMYDQRNAGRSQQGDIADMTVEQHAADAVELTDILRERFGEEKIYLLGHSWGAQLGLFVAQAAPKKYHALVNTGQALITDVGEICEDFIRSSVMGTELEEEYLAGLREQKELLNDLWQEGNCINEAVAPLGGEIHGETQEALGVLLPTMLRAPEYRPLDIVNIMRFNNEHRWALNDQALELGTDITELDLPVFFFLGRYDYVTPSIAAEQFFDELSAPYKEIVWFEESAHFTFFEEPEKFARELVRVKNEVQADKPLAFIER